MKTPCRFRVFCYLVFALAVHSIALAAAKEELAAALRAAILQNDPGALRQLLTAELLAPLPGDRADLLRKAAQALPGGVTDIRVATVDETPNGARAMVEFVLHDRVIRRSFSLDGTGRIFATDFAGNIETRPPRPAAQTVCPSRTVLPMRIVKRMILLEGELDGVRGWLLFDTGASRPVVNSAHIPWREPADGPVVQFGFDANGPILTPFQRVDRLVLGEMRLSGVDAVRIDLSRLERWLDAGPLLGLVGHSAFHDLEVVFDYKQSQLALCVLDEAGRPLNPHVARKPKSEHSLRLERHLPVVTLHTHGFKAATVLDSGAASGLVSPVFRARVGTSAKPLGSSTVGSATGRSEKRELVGMDFRLDDGPVYRNVPLTVTELSHMSDSIDAVVGYHLLSAQVCAINYRRHRLILW